MKYQEQVITNAKVMVKVLTERGLRIVSGDTDCHMFLVDLQSKNINGKEAEASGTRHREIDSDGGDDQLRQLFATQVKRFR